jgi:GAF domain-containing protein
MLGVPGAHGPQKILLVADQFEELVTPANDLLEADRDGSLRAGFVQCLRAATDSSKRAPAARCVITLRAAHLHQPLLRKELPEILQECQVVLGPMTREELRAAITEPARRLDVTFDEGLVENIVNSFLAQGDGGLPLLEFALAELWAELRRNGGRRLRALDRATGGNALTTALERHAKQVYEQLVRHHAEAAFRKVMCDLVWFSAGGTNSEHDSPYGDGPRDTRRVRRRGDFNDLEWALVEQLASHEWAVTEQLASHDRQARLVVTGWDRTTGEPTAEIVHDALIHCWPRLRDWVEKDRPFRLWLQKTEAAALEWREERDPRGLLRRRKLRDAEGWQARRPEAVTSVAAFIARSLEAEAHEKDQQLQIRATQYTGAVESAASRLFELNGKLVTLCKDIKKHFRLDFVSVQWRDKEARTIGTIHGEGLEDTWYGIAKHNYVGPSLLWDIQADILESAPPRAEILWGYDRRFDAFVFEKFGHKDKRRVFAPILVRAAPGPMPAPQDWLTVRGERPKSGSQGRIVLELQNTQPAPGRGRSYEVMGTVEAGYNDLSRHISPETAKELVAYASRPELRLSRATLEYMFRTIAVCARRIVKADVASVHFPYDPEGERYLVEAVSGWIVEAPGGLSGTALRSQAVQLGRPVDRHDDWELDHQESTGGEFGHETTKRLRAAAAVPISFKEERGANWTGPEKKGVLYVGFNKPHEFTDGELRTLVSFARSATEAVRRATSYMSAQEETRRLKILHSVTQSLADNLMAPRLLDDIAGNALNMFAADLVTIHEYNGKDGSFSDFGTAGRFIEDDEARRPLEAGGSPAPLLVIQGKDDLYAEEIRVGSPMLPREKGRGTGARRFVKRERIVSAAAVILRAGNEVIGVMFINYRSRHHFSQEERRFIEMIGSSAATAIRNRRLVGPGRQGPASPAPPAGPPKGPKPRPPDDRHGPDMV